MSEFSEPIVYNERGKRVRDAQSMLNGNNFFERDFMAGGADGIWGKNSMSAADLARYVLGYPEEYCKTGRFGQQLADYLRADGNRKTLPPAFLARRITRLAAAARHRVPGLPSRVWFPNAWYPRPPTRHGCQPWIEPQIDAIVKKFGMHRALGHGGHPPHGTYSDHAWGGAVDLMGPLQAMIDCTYWADRLCSGFYRRGAVFRWVGGPAHDANGIERGHYNHVHLSWYRRGPATTIFGTPGFSVWT